MLLLICSATILGLCIVNDWKALSIQWGYLIGDSCLAASVLDSLFFNMCYMAFSQTFLEDLGPRLTFPLMWSGCTFFLWRHIASMAPRFGTFLFYNPVTHISEGIQRSYSESLWYCSHKQALVFYNYINRTSGFVSLEFMFDSRLLGHGNEN